MVVRNQVSFLLSFFLSFFGLLFFCFGGGAYFAPVSLVGWLTGWLAFGGFLSFFLSFFLFFSFLFIPFLLFSFIFACVMKPFYVNSNAMTSLILQKQKQPRKKMKKQRKETNRKAKRTIGYFQTKLFQR